MPVRDYIPYRMVAACCRGSCRGQLTRAEPDDDINYSVLALTAARGARCALDHRRRRASLAAAAALARRLHRRAGGLPDARRRGAASRFTRRRRARLRPRRVRRQPLRRLDRRADPRRRLRLGLPGRPAREQRRWRRSTPRCRTAATAWTARGSSPRCGAAIPARRRPTTPCSRRSTELPPTEAARRRSRSGGRWSGADDAVDALHERYGHLSPSTRSTTWRSWCGRCSRTPTTSAPPSARPSRPGWTPTATARPSAGSGASPVRRSRRRGPSRGPGRWRSRWPGSTRSVSTS